MKKLFTFILIFVLELFIVLAPGAAYADGGYAGLAAINKIILNTPGITSQSIGGITTATATATENAVLANGLRIPIPTTASVATSAARFGAVAAASIIKGATIAGIATVVIPWIFEESGYSVCSIPEGIFCKTVKTVNPGQFGWTKLTGGYGTYTEAVASVKLFYCPPNSPYEICTNSFYNWQPIVTKVDSTHYDIWLYSTSTNQGRGSTFRTTYEGVTGAEEGSKFVPITENELTQSLTNSLSKDSVKQQIINNTLRENNIPVIQPTDLVTTSAPPVSATPIVETSTQSNTDGTTSTKTVTQQTTVNPVKTGTTVGDTNYSYPSTTVTTTTIVNNTTNNTTTTSTTKNETAGSETPSVVSGAAAPAPAPAADIKFPTDYNREVTQQAILEKLTGTGVPDSSTINPDTDLEKITAQNSYNKSAFDAINSGYLGLVNWFPSFPTAVCVNPTVPNPISHALVAVDICTPLSIFKIFISGVLCFFVLVASVREVQSAIQA